MPAEKIPEWYKFEDERPRWLRGKFGQLSDLDIRRCLEEGIIKIEPLDLKRLDKIITNSCKIDFHLGNVITSFKKTQLTEIELGKPVPDELQEDVYVRDGQFYVLHPGDYVLAQTKERLILPNYITARMEGKSSVGRLGLTVQQAAIFDAGWNGIPTMELTNLGIIAVKLRPGVSICAFSFQLLTTPAKKVYSGRYQGQTGPQA